MLICTFYQKNVDKTEIFELYHVDHLHQTFTYFISLSSSSGNFKGYIECISDQYCDQSSSLIGWSSFLLQGVGAYACHGAKRLGVGDGGGPRTCGLGENNDKTQLGLEVDPQELLHSPTSPRGKHQGTLDKKGRDGWEKVNIATLDPQSEWELRRVDPGQSQMGQ